MKLMDKNWRRAGLPIALLCTATLFRSSAGQRPKTAREAYKNIQVLGDIKESDLLPAMNLIAGSLGVTCEHCHTNPWQSDLKPAKTKAREMLEMLRKLNKESFKGQSIVTCYTCHRGRVIPAFVPPLEDAAWKRTASGSASSASQVVLPNI